MDQERKAMVGVIGPFQTCAKFASTFAVFLSVCP